MPSSTRRSSASSSCRLEWRPSRLQLGLLALIVALAAFSVLHCALPAALAWPAAGLVCVCGGWQLRREWRRPVRSLVFGPSFGLQVDGVVVERARLHWRGPLAFLRWRRPGARRDEALAWWPDTLPPAQRRELRLAAGEGVISPRTGVMAP